MNDFKDKAMTEDRFEDLLAAYGADPMHWPESERAAGIALMESGNARIGSLLVNAREIDALLNFAMVPEMSAGIIARLQADAHPGIIARLKLLLDWQGSLWQPAGALTAALVLGIGLGFANPQEASAVANFTNDTIETQPDTETLDILLSEEDTL